MQNDIRMGTEYEKEVSINALLEDYQNYLIELTYEQIELIIQNGVFTFREAKEEAEKIAKKEA
jgi:hypothetical protein